MIELEEIKEPFFHLVHICLDSYSLRLAATILIVVTSVASLTWSITSYHSKRTIRGEQGGIIPPTRPYLIPVLGSLFSILRSLESCLYWSGSSTFGIKFLNQVIYVLNDQQDIAKMRKHRGVVAPPVAAAMISKRLFDIPSKCVEMYLKDNSGLDRIPAADSDVQPHNRIDFLQMDHYHRSLEGKNALVMFEKFYNSWLQDPRMLSITNEWQTFPDIFSFWMLGMVESLNNGLAGPILSRINKDFSANMVEFSSYCLQLLKGLPRWYIPRAFELRESLFRDARAWQDEARALDRQNTSTDDTIHWWWGSPLMQKHQDFLPHIDNWDYESVAKADVGLLFGAHINVHAMSIWALVNVFKNPTDLSRLRQEIERSTLDPKEMTTLEYNRVLLGLPYLHAVYLECLRLHSHTYALFYTEKQSVKINEWEIPQGHIFMSPTKFTQMDETVWNTDGGKHSVSSFWPDRFLGHSGSKVKAAHKVADKMFPYGFGKRICPGRGVAEKMIKAVCAHIVINFDLEILTKESEFPTDPRYYGFGTSRPLHNIPFRLKHRKHVSVLGT